ncbi:hypothetical protein CUMW_206490 [Citrus unshiu]|nr:hypothetical protein CUMW_206490 [Citrus unshiu]
MVIQMFLLDIDGASGGILLLWIVGICILLPLVVAVIYLSKSAKYTGNYVMHHTLSTYYYFMKPSLAPSKVMEVFIKAAEYMEIPVRRTDDEPLQKLFMSVRSELNLDLKNIKQEQAKFWKQHPAIVKTELLIQAQLTRGSAALSPALLGDFRRMAVIPRTAQGHGWLRPAVGVVELSQSIIQAVPLSSRKATGGSTEGTAPFLQLPHFTEAVIKKIARKKVRTFQELRDMSLQDRAELLSQVGGFSSTEVQDVEMVYKRVTIVTIKPWVTLKRGNGLIGALPHAPYYPFHKEENFWFLLADSVSNNVWFSQKVSFHWMNLRAITAASKAIEDTNGRVWSDCKETSAGS